MSYRRLIVTVGVSLACSSQEGTQTGGEGQLDGCRTVSTTAVDVDAARSLGFPVDEHLPLFEQVFDAPFHRGNLDCSALPASVDGRIEVSATLQGLDHEQREPTVASVSEACPAHDRDRLVYRATIELRTDEGTLSGNVTGRAYLERPAPGQQPYAGLVFFGESTPEGLEGSLGIRADMARAHEATVGWQVALGAPAFGSRVVTAVDYTDGQEPVFDQGDGMFWPADFLEGQELCGWLDFPGEQRAPMSVDQYNGLPTP